MISDCDYHKAKGDFKMRVLAIGAHPDDLELLCGGTLAKYAKRGDEVFMAVATNGNVGSPTLGKEEIAAVRYEEAKRAAAVIGAHLIWMNFPDEFLFNDRDTRIAFIDAIRQARPDVMFVHGTNDYHPDHRTAGQVAVDARIPATVRLVETAYPYCDRIPHLFVMDNVAGIDFEPEAYVDITDTIETKREMLLKHKSQDTWLKSLYGSDQGILHNMEIWSARRGAEIQTKFAEAFRSIRTYPLTGDNHLLP